MGRETETDHRNSRRAQASTYRGNCHAGVYSCLAGDRRRDTFSLLPMAYRIATIPGDGIGTEAVEPLRVLRPPASRSTPTEFNLGAAPTRRGRCCRQ